jgi:hypothetical protein
MQDCAFREPVTLYQTRHDGGLHAVRICTTREAFKVLTVGKVPVSAVEWQTAFDKLVKALLDPMPRKVEEARDALLRLSATVTLPSDHARRSLH